MTAKIMFFRVNVIGGILKQKENVCFVGFYESLLVLNIRNVTKDFMSLLNLAGVDEKVNTP